MEKLHPRAEMEGGQISARPPAAKIGNYLEQRFPTEKTTGKRDSQGLDHVSGGGRA